MRRARGRTRVSRATGESRVSRVCCLRRVTRAGGAEPAWGRSGPGARPRLFRWGWTLGAPEAPPEVPGRSWDLLRAFWLPSAPRGARRGGGRGSRRGAGRRARHRRALLEGVDLLQQPPDLVYLARV